MNAPTSEESRTGAVAAEASDAPRVHTSEPAGELTHEVFHDFVELEPMREVWDEPGATQRRANLTPDVCRICSAGTLVETARPRAFSHPSFLIPTA